VSFFCARSLSTPSDDLLEGGPPEAEDKKNKEHEHELDDPRAARTASLAATLRADPLLYPTAPAACAGCFPRFACSGCGGGGGGGGGGCFPPAAAHRYAPLITGDHDAEAPRVYHPYAAVSEDNIANSNNAAAPDMAESAVPRLL
jgi:hypothetical protein